MSEATITFRDSPHREGIAYFEARCGQCSYAAFGSASNGKRPTAESVLQDHLDQHKPGRAVDIEVAWELSACCSVCEDGIGSITLSDSESLRCRDCGTVWSLDGTGGERSE